MVRIPAHKNESLFGFGLQFDGIKKTKKVNLIPLKVENETYNPNADAIIKFANSPHKDALMSNVTALPITESYIKYRTDIIIAPNNNLNKIFVFIII